MFVCPTRTHIVAASLFLSCAVMQIASADSKLKPLPDEEVAAVVNGAQISKTIVDRVSTQIQASNQGQQINRERVIDELVNLELLTQEAEKMNLGEDEGVVSALRIQYLQTMANGYLAEISKLEEFSDEELRAVHDSQITQNRNPEFNASHILLDEEADAAAAIEALKNGEDFAELAKKLSTGPSGPSGGELGWFDATSMVAEFSAAVATMEVGGVSAAPVQTQFGWHVIKLNDKRSPPEPDFEANKDAYRNQLISGRLTKKIDDIRAAATIEIK